MSAMVERLRELVTPVCGANGVELYDVEYSGGIVRVTVEREGGVDLDTIAAITREVSRVFDAVDPISGRYTLEVSSPGLERTLRTPAHFAGAVGRDVRVKTTVEVDGERRHDGVLVAVDDAGVVVRVTPPGKAVVAVERHLDFSVIDKARTVFVWGPAPKPGSAKGAAKKAAPAPADPEAPTDKAVMP